MYLCLIGNETFMREDDEMNKYTFSTQTGKAYYCNSIPGFIKDTSTSIIGHLVKRAFDNNDKQIDAWNNQICELQRKLEECAMEGDIIFEYDIVRLGKRIDVILLIKHMVFSLEFKNGKNMYTAMDAQQAEDYAIELQQDNIVKIFRQCSSNVRRRKSSIVLRKTISNYRPKEVFTLFPFIFYSSNQSASKYFSFHFILKGFYHLSRIY